jgi:hypothetical protein
LLGDGDKVIEIVYGEENYCVLGPLEQPRKNRNLLNRQDEPIKPSKEGPLSFVILESPFTSVSTVGRGHPSLVCPSESVYTNIGSTKDYREKIF